MVDAPIRFDPIILTVIALYSVLVRVGAPFGDGFIDGHTQALTIIGMHRRDDLLQRDAAMAQGGIKAETPCKSCINGEAIGWQVPEPCADDGAGVEGELNALG